MKQRFDSLYRLRFDFNGRVCKLAGELSLPAPYTFPVITLVYSLRIDFEFKPRGLVCVLGNLQCSLKLDGT